MKRFFLILAIFGLTFYSLSFFNSNEKDDKEVEQNQVVEVLKVPEVIKFIQTDNSGKGSSSGNNYAVLFNPKSERLDFKVNVGLSGDIYDCLPDESSNDDCFYKGKRFGELVFEENAKLNGKLPIAAINADYIDENDHPQGYNVSRGVEYSGDFENKRSSFAISKDGEATVQIGERVSQTNPQSATQPAPLSGSDDFNYNAVGGNGRFYKNGEFLDICDALGVYACEVETERSMAVTTSSGWVVFLVHDASDGNRLLPSDFQPLLEKIVNDNDLGEIEEGILFDGGSSPGLMYDNEIYVENSGNIGSVFLVYLN